MRLARLLLLALVTLGLFSFIYFYERKKPSTEELRERQGKLFPDLASEKITKLIVHNRNGQFEFSKEDGTWKLVAPIKDDADSGAVTSLLSQLANLKAERTISVGEVKLSDYGLDSPERWVEAKDEAGGSYRVSFGQELPLGNNAPAITNGDQVFLISKWILSDVDKDLSGFRSSNLLPFSTMEVNAITVVSPQGRLVAARSGSFWSLTEPVSDFADREEVEGILTDLAGGRIKQFLDEGGDAQTLGLANPRFTVTLVRKQGAPVTLKFGAEREEGGSKQVACQRGERLFWVEASTTSHLAKKPQEFRSGKLLPFSTWQVDKLVLERGAEKLEVERKEGVWRKAGGGEVDSGSIFTRLNTLADLKVLAFDQPQPSGPPLGKVRILGQDELELEASFFPGSQQDQVLAVVKGRPNALAVDRAKVEEVLAGVAATGKDTPSSVPAAGKEPTK